uniref:Secreted protein n=1 Tax=Romanomermis culicivorax TaxID=13658 RepID=A0A915KQF3_ROMCU
MIVRCTSIFAILIFAGITLPYGTALSRYTSPHRHTAPDEWLLYLRAVWRQTVRAAPYGAVWCMISSYYTYTPHGTNAPWVFNQNCTTNNRSTYEPVLIATPPEHFLVKSILL